MQMLLVLLCISVALSGCLFTHVKTPYDTNLDKTVLGAKKGEATLRSVLWLVAWGDAGTAAASDNGQIKTLNQMDREILSVLFGLYYQETTIVYGN